MKKIFFFAASAVGMFLVLSGVRPADAQTTCYLVTDLSSQGYVASLQTCNVAETGSSYATSCSPSATAGCSTASQCGCSEVTCTTVAASLCGGTGSGPTSTPTSTTPTLAATLALSLNNFDFQASGTTEGSGLVMNTGDASSSMNVTAVSSASWLVVSAAPAGPYVAGQSSADQAFTVSVNTADPTVAAAGSYSAKITFTATPNAGTASVGGTPQTVGVTYTVPASTGTGTGTSTTSGTPPLTTRECPVYGCDGPLPSSTLALYEPVLLQMEQATSAFAAAGIAAANGLIVESSSDNTDGGFMWLITTPDGKWLAALSYGTN